MLKLRLERRWKRDSYTIGALFVNDVRFSETVEDCDRGLDSSWSEAAIKAAKIVGKTAIPTGTYKVVLSVSQKFKNKSWAKKYGGLVPEIVGVKGYVGIRIHPGANAEQTEGCPLVGDNKIKGGLTNSLKRYDELMSNHLVPAWNRNEGITISIE